MTFFCYSKNNATPTNGFVAPENGIVEIYSCEMQMHCAQNGSRIDVCAAFGCPSNSSKRVCLVGAGEWVCF
jgi:hypothetical protein